VREIGCDIGVVERIHDPDGLPGALIGDGAEAVSTRIRAGEIPVGEVVASVSIRKGGCACPGDGRYVNTGRPRSAS